jgi:hypothetical protein
MRQTQPNRVFWLPGKSRQEDIRTKVYCCFNHLVGLLTKERIDRPIFNYEKLIRDSLLIPDFSNPLRHDFKRTAKSVQSSFPASTTTSPNEVDSDIDPQVSNEDYCSGYQHGFADTTNELLTK